MIRIAITVEAYEAIVVTLPQRRLRSRPGEMAFCPLQTALSQAAAARYRLDALGAAEKLPAQEVVGIGASRVYWLRNPRACRGNPKGGRPESGISAVSRELGTSVHFVPPVPKRIR